MNTGSKSPLDAKKMERSLWLPSIFFAEPPHLVKTNCTLFLISPQKPSEAGFVGPQGRLMCLPQEAKRIQAFSPCTEGELPQRGKRSRPGACRGERTGGGPAGSPWSPSLCDGGRGVPFMQPGSPRCPPRRRRWRIWGRSPRERRLPGYRRRYPRPQW